MKRLTEITTFLLDIGGVLLTNGWDHHARKRAATNFNLELAEMEDRHHLTFETYEEGKLTLEEYLVWRCSIKSGLFLWLSFGNSCSPSRGHVPR